MGQSIDSDKLAHQNELFIREKVLVLMGVNLNKWVNHCLFIEESGLLGKGVYMMRLGGV